MVLVLLKTNKYEGSYGPLKLTMLTTRLGFLGTPQELGLKKRHYLIRVDSKSELFFDLLIISSDGVTSYESANLRCSFFFCIAKVRCEVRIGL